MTPERWTQLETLLQEALDLPLEERGVFLKQACRDDNELRNEAATLIAAHESAGDFIERPVLLSDAHIILDYQRGKNIGREVGVYRIQEWLGAGGMGEVYSAEDRRLRRRVALKLLPSYFASDDERLARFEREAQTASALNHPNILTIHEVGQEEDVRFIATEFIEGQTLHKLVSGKQLALGEILDIAIQIVSGLSAAHAAGIVHRDIKPDNIMRRHDGLVKLLDFGIAKLLEPVAESESQTAMMQTETGTLIGTVSYMSPEQARGLTIDERSDIWSFGVVLYQLIAQRLPFAGPTRMDTLVNILEREPHPLFPDHELELPAELRALAQLVTKSLQKDRADRQQTANQLLDELKLVRRQLERAGLAQGQTIAQLLSQPRVLLTGERWQNQVIADRSARRSFTLIAATALLLTVVVAAVSYQWSREPAATPTAAASDSGRFYGAMKDSEQLDFIRSQEQRISAMMGDRPGKLDEDALRSIKGYVDRYLARRGSASAEKGKEDLQAVYLRSHPYLPTIARSFAARKVPIIIGIYLPLVESEYRPCFESQIGAKGLFQFMPETARRYGVAPDDRCNVERSAPAAASYLADHMAELGDDAESMTLVLLSYNTGATWVRETLRQLRDSDNFERTFWTLFHNRERLDATFQTEGAGYVPMFFAAAIIGENPRAFGLELEPLTALANATVVSANKNLAPKHIEGMNRRYAN